MNYLRELSSRLKSFKSKLKTQKRYIASLQFKTFLRPRRRVAIAEACLIGLVSGLSGVLLKVSVGALGSWRVHASHFLPAWIVLPAIGVSFGFLSGWLVERQSPEAAGSGIPYVKAALAQFPIALNLRVAIVKLLSSILALGSGLTLGRQGPTVHVGAAVAAQLSHWVPTSPDHRRQMIAAGAGAGLAAGFNAPIAGVLFIVEELLQDLSDLTLGTAILASFIGAVVSRLLGGRSLELNLTITASQSSFSVQEIPFYLLLGALAGLLGAWFCKGIFASLGFYRTLKLPLSQRVALAGLISGIAIALLPESFRDNTGLREFLVTGEAAWQFTTIAFVVQYILTLVACGSGAPGGLFSPSLILGSGLGYLVGLLQQATLGVGSPATYSLAGMGAFFCAVAKAPITSIVIVFEMTMDFNLVLPLMIGSVVSYLVSEKITRGSLYSRLLEWNGIHLEKKPTTDGLLANLKAEDVMQRRVETLPSNISLDEATQAFSRSHHRGFPVVDKGLLVGIVTQTDLAIYKERSLPGNLPLSRIMTPQPVTVGATASLGDVLYLLNRYQISRLPVTEGRKLIGIITRADIIKAEADKLNGQTGSIGPRSEPSYVVYQTRAPAIGTGRMLVPLANPQTAPALLQMAAAIARDRNYELECLQVILVGRSSAPAQSPVKTGASRRLLRQAEKLGKELNIPIHTQIRVSHDIAQAILETINERHINVLLMGWKGTSITQGRIFGDVVDTIIRQAPCELVLVKIGQGFTSNSSFCLLPSAFRKWLVPIAGGPNAQQALQILPSLLSLSHTPAIQLAQIFHPSTLLPDTAVLEKSALFLSRQLSASVMAIPVRASSVSDAVINLAHADDCDVVVLGASREGMLQQAIKGNIPEAIARGVKSTVILVRSAQ
ncbi:MULTISPECIES: chloride channel protein [Cyanophyceae]|uniref:chloride channel protein n=1 Tax=Cyanophyceae TaxID=3028117 RepID=UPI001685385C|nr:chloride channel protein [Trichocoleus sp. FACHB-40]MBD2005130.1 chloride channel protein [Trichocoleus sp. FACHB-40]